MKKATVREMLTQLNNQSARKWAEYATRESKRLGLAILLNERGEIGGLVTSDNVPKELIIRTLEEMAEVVRNLDDNKLGPIP